MSAPPRPVATCDGCRAPLAADQRYCLHCGTRRGGTRVDPALAWSGDPAAPAAAPAPPASTPPMRPGRRVSAVLAVLTLFAGALVGALVGGPPASSLAATRAAAVVVDETGLTPAAVPALPVAAAPVDDSDATDDTTDAAVTPAAVTPAAAPVDDAPAATKTTGTSTTDTPSTDDTAATPTPTTTPTATFTPPAITHVWVITLAHENYDALFGTPTQDPYLATTLAGQGTVLKDYTPVAASSLANGIALLSGQAPTTSTLADCPTSTDVPADSVDATTGLAAGDGCVYPATLPTLVTQLAATSRTWRVYLQGEGDLCRHPAAGQADPWAVPTGTDGRLSARDPFLSFHAFVDDPAVCPAHTASTDALATDLATPATTPALSWIVPDAFHDGRAGTDPTGAATGPATADAFLQQLVPQITATQTYKDGGLIAIVPDSPGAIPAAPAPVTGATTTGPTIPATGALLLSPFVQAGNVVDTAYGPYHLLRSLEDLFALGHLGHAGDSTVTAFDGSVYRADDDPTTSTTSTTSTTPTATTPTTTRTQLGGHVAVHP